MTTAYTNHSTIKCIRKMLSPYAKRMSRIRSKTVEPVLGTLKNFLNMQRVNTRGIKQANKHVLMAALCYNLKKLMKFSRPKLKFNFQQLEIELKRLIRPSNFTFFVL
ncbi:MAG: transposase [Bacteroidetes bacterium]|nr:transposase [Bacteroidota bacterium]